MKERFAEMFGYSDIAEFVRDWHALPREEQKELIELSYAPWDVPCALTYAQGF